MAEVLPAPSHHHQHQHPHCDQHAIAPPTTSTTTTTTTTASIMTSSPAPDSAPSTLSPQAESIEEATSQTTTPRQSQHHQLEQRQPLEQPLPLAQQRMSQYSLASRSRPHSNAFPPFQSTLLYALVRDFAYPPYHPMHYGGPSEDPSGVSTPGSEWNAGRRLSESAESSATGGRWSAGPWGGDGVLYGDPEQEMEPLPSTAFGNGAGGDVDWVDDETSFKKQKHRKSRSFHDMPNYERGRRRESQGRSSRDEQFPQQSQQYDPAGRDALRQSRGFVYGQYSHQLSQLQPAENGESGRRDSHFATTLPSRSFHTGQTHPDSDLPLDSEESAHHSPQRESMGPEDEELFAGPSLALYGFEPENENELRLTEGQVIMVSYRHGQGWLVAENPETGDQGLVPEQYVRLLRDIEGWDEETGQFIDGPFAGNQQEEDASTPTAEHAPAAGPSSTTGNSAP